MSISAVTPATSTETESCDGADIDDLSAAIRAGDMSPQYDLNGDGQVNDDDRGYWVRDLMTTWFGDANLDGEFNSGDLVAVLASGTYEVDVDSGWEYGRFQRRRPDEFERPGDGVE